MNHKRTLFISMLGIAAILTGYGLHNHIVKVKAASWNTRRAGALLSCRLHLDTGY